MESYYNVWPKFQHNTMVAVRKVFGILQGRFVGAKFCRNRNGCP